MQRRNFLGWLSGGVIAAALGGCGGGSKEKKHTVRGIVLEDAGNGILQPPKAGTEIITFYSEGPGKREGGKATTNEQGRFVFDLPVGYQYIFRLSGYSFSLTTDVSICATVPVVGVAEDGLRGIFYSNNGTGSILPDVWLTRSAQAARDYNTDIAILADLLCVGSYRSYTGS